MKKQDATPNDRYQSVNPADGKALKKFEELTDAELEAKIAAAATCFETWRHKTYAERAVIVAKAASTPARRRPTSSRTS